MRAEVKCVIGGHERTLALPIQGLEEVAEVNPVFAEVLDVLKLNLWRVPEVKAIVTAGLKYGGDNSDLDFGKVYEELGMRKCAELATQLWVKAWEDDSGN